mmetsp:Transcript_5447/g.23153  ORF Transcript_5447/g.23153 Transcript_5447/m.23153 type:complete len:127 (-) Transcript_5447:1097-1477(-)
MQSPRVFVVLLLLGFEVGGNSALAGKAAKELGDADRTNESEYGERYETEGEEAVGWSSLLADQITPSYGSSTMRVDNVCTRRRLSDHMCPELFIFGVQKGGTSSLCLFFIISGNLSGAENTDRLES